jgi:hypothetical protein
MLILTPVMAVAKDMDVDCAIGKGMGMKIYEKRISQLSQSCLSRRVSRDMSICPRVVTTNRPDLVAVACHPVNQSDNWRSLIRSSGVYSLYAVLKPQR